MTYDNSRNNDEVHWFIGKVGGTLNAGTNNISNTAIVGDSTSPLFIGNRMGTNNAFRNPGSGTIDEYAIWTRELTTNEITAQFAAAASGSVSVPAPYLTISPSGGSVIIAWTTNSAGYNLEYTTTLPNTNTWTAAGAPVVNGASNTVTTATSPAVRFFRLRK
jgi:hypothetical protein